MNFVKLREISLNKKGYYGIGASSVLRESGFPLYLRITDINNNLDINNLPCCINTFDYPDYNKYYLKRNDIVFARTGNSTGINYFYDGNDNKVVFAGFLIKFSIIPSDNLVPKFIKYYCQSDRYKQQISAMFTGSTRNNINAEQYGDLKIPLLKVQLQQHIVDIRRCCYVI